YRDLWWRGAVALPGSEDGVLVMFPRFTLAESLTPPDRLSAGTVLANRVSATMKLRTNVELDFDAVRIPAGNIAKDFVGVYGLWLKKAAEGWRLSFTNEPDVLGSQWRQSSVVAEVPIQYESISATGERFTAALEERPGGGGRLVFTYGPHRWSTDFAVRKTVVR